MKQPLKVLVLCDTRGDSEALGAEFCRAGYDVSVSWADAEAGLKQALGKTTFDIAVCDRDFDGLDIATAHGLIAESAQDLAFFIISGTLPAEAQRVINQLRAGVDGFIEWGRPERLAPIVEQGLRTVERRRHARRATADIRHRADHDGLTNIPNRTLFLDRLSQAMKAARRTGKRVLVLYLDLDRFKPVNDAYGHIAGDRLLTEAAHRITACLRDSDTAGRIGGDEFAVILADAESPEAARPIAEKLLAALAQPFDLGGYLASVTASIGISVFPDDGGDCQTLLQAADDAMYAAKAGGRNGFRMFSPAAATTRLVGSAVAPIPAAAGMALAAAIAAMVITAAVLTSKVPEDSLKTATDGGSEVLKDFGTAGGPKE